MSEQPAGVMTVGTTDNGKDLVQVKNLVKYFPVRSGLLQRIVAWVQLWTMSVYCQGRRDSRAGG